ncbi:YqaJ viral recombinase family protein [Stenotrophomonas sp.]|uniref:YqaJ viral recombinase family protein n=1 Tax=Stenotrophomonas sp. TaxID=69392 RepID=UPI0028A8C1F3|nr:YqaJ viral recombinase family protein [Stenotrophomonas sp.]
MKTVELIQGTPKWHAHRAHHLNASDAPAMLGASTNHSRIDLIRELAAGVPREFSDFVQERVIDPGHEFEAQARVIAEGLIGQDLYPVTGVSGKYSASFDGLTLLEDIAWEHKRLNQTLRDAMFDGCTGTDLPLMYQIQMEHQAMVSQAEHVFFMASEWKRVGDQWELVEERHCWYTPNPELRARIVQGWAQLEADVAAYEPEAPAAPPAAGRAPDQMPALRIEVTGMVTASNLAEWKDRAIAVFQGISQDLTTDQDFADAEKTVKWCGEIEDQLKGAKQHALSQTESIDELFRTIDAISEQARATRLALDKLVTKRKEERRTEIGNNARRAVQDHVRAINETLGEHGLQMPATLIADLQAAMKGKRSFASMQDAVDAVATNAKITASQAADRIRANVAILAEHQEHATLFADRVQLCASKAPEDLRNLVAARIAEHTLAEQKRLDDERARIRQEEEARARKLADEEARVKAQAEEAAKVAAAPTPEPVAAALEPVLLAGLAAVASRSAPVLTSAPAPQAAAPVAAAPHEVVKIKLGDINARIAPLSISADGLAQLGFKPVNATGAAKLYDQAQFPAMCEALIEGLRYAAEQYPMAA